MKALSLTQPWATLIAIGAKEVETRSWSTEHRGRIAIHASKAFPEEAREFVVREPAWSYLRDLEFGDLPLGAIIASARLVDVRKVRTDGIEGLGIGLLECAFGNYTPGRYAWFLEDVRPLPEPLPARGKLGLWEYEGGGICRVCGCSQFDACEAGCSWFNPDLCTECVAAEQGIFV